MEIFLSFTFQSLISKIGIDGHVIEQYLPAVAPLTRYCLWYAIPACCSELLDVNILLTVNNIMDFYRPFLHLAFSNLSQNRFSITFFIFFLLHFKSILEVSNLFFIQMNSSIKLSWNNRIRFLLVFTCWVVKDSACGFSTLGWWLMATFAFFFRPFKWITLIVRKDTCWIHW